MLQLAKKEQQKAHSLGTSQYVFPARITIDLSQNGFLSSLPYHRQKIRLNQSPDGLLFQQF
jgi:hypothetical protein